MIKWFAKKIVRAMIELQSVNKIELTHGRIFSREDAQHRVS